MTDNLKKEGSGRKSATGSRKRGSAGQVRNSHCSFCGERFAPDSLWPRECAGCGNKSYQNPLPVVVVLVPVGEGIVGVRRNIEPQKGTVTLPGGFLDLGESWQEGGRREVLEETGIEITGGELQLFEVMNGLDDTLVIFGLAPPQPAAALHPFSSEETQEVLLIERPREMGFTMHTEVLARYFREKAHGHKDKDKDKY